MYSTKIELYSFILLERPVVARPMPLAPTCEQSDVFWRAFVRITRGRTLILEKPNPEREKKMSRKRLNALYIKVTGIAS